MSDGDQYGALVVPIDPVDALAVAGDPALGFVLEFLKASVNSDCGIAWDSVCIGRKPIEFTFAHDPKKLFDESRLPAIYVWRGKSRRSRLADDLYMRTSLLQIAWIQEPGEEELTIGRRDSMMNAIANAIDNAITGDRHSSWFLTGDADPIAALRGSSISDACGFSRFQPSNDGPQELLFQRVEEAAPLPYYGFVMEVECDEYQTKALQTKTPSKLVATISTNDG